MKHFKILFILIISAVLFTVLPILDYWNMLPQKIYYAKDFDIIEHKSSFDTDYDNIDDSHDILFGARDYINSGLKYKSGYYAGGYPTDGYSVCTDVIWNAFQSAVIDLKSLVDQDISDNTEFYPLDNPDPNIDFRRVKNLKVFFERHAISLTTDITQIEEWQPGDIVTFAPSHIGIISDKRNKDGIPYLIHYSGQPNKEEDCIVKRSMEITGHYRWR
ncbi:MAG: DUF1287 domain-containing protein [Erysipelotrichaceae bacterium]|nr:DUF1287 domain-containing protein [Erysipelotrichaceae bacterium]